MDGVDLFNDSYDKLKLSALSKYFKISKQINNVTLGPSSQAQCTNLGSDVKKTVQKSESNKNRDDQPDSTYYSVAKLAMQRLEEIRQESVDEALRSRFKAFTSDKDRRSKICTWREEHEAFIAQVEAREKMILHIVEAPNADKLREKEELVQQFRAVYQEQINELRKSEEQKRRQKEMQDYIDEILRIQVNYRTMFEQLVPLVNNNKNLAYVQKFVSSGEFQLSQQHFKTYIDRAKNKEICADDVKNALKLINDLSLWKNKIEYELQEKQSSILAKNPAVLSTQEVIENALFSKSPRLHIFEAVMNFRNQYSEQFKKLLILPTLKQFRFDCKKAVNVPINALSAVNSSHLRDKCLKLRNLLLGNAVPIGSDKTVTAAQHHVGIQFCTDLLAQKFVLQGDLTVSSNPEAAFAYATVILTLWMEFPQFGQLLLSYFYEQCPCLVPLYFPEKLSNETDEQYYIKCGYKYIDGNIEMQDKFLKRMTGIMRLYFAITISHPCHGIVNKLNVAHPQDVTVAWQWLCAILEMEPQLDITATAIHIFLETLGYIMDIKYGDSFRQAVGILQTRLLPMLKLKDSGGPVSRLEALLNEYDKKKQFTPPRGMLQPNFW